jgi:hypothetical protein
MANKYERFAKWQGITREQLGTTSNLVLGLATGLLGFVNLLILDGKISNKCGLCLSISASGFLVLSICLALWCALNRLIDFRYTTQIANPKHFGTAYQEELRELSKRYGESTWNIFKGQIFCFAIGSCAIVISILIQIFNTISTNSHS